MPLPLVQAGFPAEWEWGITYTILFYSSPAKREGQLAIHSVSECLGYLFGAPSICNNGEGIGLLHYSLFIRGGGTTNDNECWETDKVIQVGRGVPGRREGRKRVTCVSFGSPVQGLVRVLSIMSLLRTS